MPFHPYLMFGGNCRDALTRYQEIFGGELDLLTYAEMAGGGPLPPELEQSADLLAHASLTFDGHLLMASDDADPEFGPVQGMEVMYSTDDPAEAERVYDALADGGEVKMPFGPQPWSPAFGTCTDRFGTPWMVNTDAPADAG